MDDSSRIILAGGEFDDAKQEHVISLMNNVLNEYSNLYEIEQVLTDRGSQFYAIKGIKITMEIMCLKNS